MNPLPDVSIIMFQSSWRAVVKISKQQATAVNFQFNMCEQKIDEVLNKLDLLIGRVDTMEKSLSRFDQRITKVEMNVGKLEAKIYEIQSEKATYAKLDELEQKIKSSLEKLEKRIENVTDLAQESAYDNKKSALKNESYSKRFNLWIRDVKGKINYV